MDNQAVEKYRLLCISELKGFLQGTFINTDPYEQSDQNIILEADARSRAWLHSGQSYLSQSAQFCSLMTVDGVMTNVYHQDRYVEVLQFHPMNCRENWRAEIPFNHFQYPMMLDSGRDEAFDESKAKYACCLDDLHDKDEILASISGLVLYSYHLGGITKFGQKRNIYRLAGFTRENLTDVIRREMLKAQGVIIACLAKYPEFCRPQHNPVEVPASEACKIMQEACGEMNNLLIERSALVRERLRQYSAVTEKI